MLLIKYLSLILLLPSFFVGRKLIRKEDLNFFDLIIIFNTLYFVVIPLKSSEAVFKAIGKITSSTTIFVFLYILFFFIGCIIASNLIGKHENSPINITYYLKRFPKLKANLALKIALVILPIFSITYYIPHMSLIAAFEGIQEANKNISYEQSSMIQFFGTIFRLGLVISTVLFVQNIDEKKYDVLTVISMLLFLVNFLMLSRRELLETLLFVGIVIYSFNRALINKKLISYAIILGAFLYFVYFPFYNIIRRTPVEFKIQSPIASIQKIYDYGIDNFGNSSESASELTDSRAIYLYRAIYWLAINDSERDITWGGITLLAIDHAIPKAINPNKGLGSEKVLEKRQHTNKDSADSILLIALADFSILGSVISVLIYFLIYKLWFFISKGSEFFFGKTMVSLYVVYFLFNLAFGTEKRLDAILADTVAYCLAIALITLVHKINLLKILDRKEPIKNLQ
ncbi:oligosaccharide repeat unit polymerase [Zobellia laminariae]|uniref:oligosaccharide repeat unit polymerase n=1 Tax=Zobellia laminariae TaxID=248906 RepID=UPI0012D8B96E|nr:hypothetical protein [Zobellia laminariae]